MTTLCLYSSKQLSSPAVKAYQKSAGAVAPQRGTVSFVLHRAFPDFATMQATYPVLSRYPVLLPWFWGHRLVRRLVGNPRVVAKELGVHAKMKR